MTALRVSALALTVAAGLTSTANAEELTIAIVNNGHMINMQKVAEAYTEETGVKLNWVSLEEGVLREQVTSDTATGGGPSMTRTTFCLLSALVCPMRAPCMRHHFTVKAPWLCTVRT